MQQAASFKDISFRFGKDMISKITLATVPDIRESKVQH